MKNTFNIFYSWQSDIPSNRNKIENSIKKAIIELQKTFNKNLELEINLDRDTKNTSGSPEIADTILTKISCSDIFVCDVTIINNSILNKFTKQRLTSNPNVLLELGYAIRHLGWERIICINNIKYGKSENLPFDIRNHRIASLDFNGDDSKQELTRTLKGAISIIVENYDEIIERFNSNKISYHDRGIFIKISEICSEDFLKDSISLAVNSLYSNKYIYSKWDKLFYFYNTIFNRFLDNELNELFQLFLNSLDSFRMLCYQKFVDREKGEMTIFDYEEAGITLIEEKRIEILQNERSFAHKDAFQNETWPEADIRIHELQIKLYEIGESVINEYQEFIIKYKKQQIE